MSLNFFLDVYFIWELLQCHFERNMIISYLTEFDTYEYQLILLSIQGCMNSSYLNN